MNVQNKDKKPQFLSRGTVAKIKDEFPYGTVVRLVKMDDSQAPPLGTVGIVVGVDDIGSLLMEWVDGSRLSLIPYEDEFEKVGAEDESE